ncbi:CIH_collapsed_G0017940.mRNA.1.CDS.1 [Saccharomyces cerevisiae]|nr:CIH_collapsed_G0017940.mRNA.1.CDS.1 [Saccharomyces cerevisiae]
MSQSNPILRGLVITTAIAALSATGYAIYFDYQRRNSPQFRKVLRQRAKEQAKMEEQAKTHAKEVKLQKVTEFLSMELAKDPIPSDPSEREATFTTNVENGERLSMQQGKELEAASKFYKALTVYPQPADLLGIYQRSIPEAIYEYIILMIAILPPANVASFVKGVVGSKAESDAVAEANDIDD